MSLCRNLLIIVCLALLALNGLAAASAQDLGEAPAEQLAGQQSYLKFRKNVYDMVILGDVLGTGIWAGMNRVVETEDRLTVTGRIQENSGLARPKLYNWTDAAVKILEARRFDIAAIMIGANDARDIESEQGTLSFGSLQWREAYAAQLGSLVRVLKQRDVAVYWFGVPPMARKPYDEAMSIVADVERQVMAELGVRYIDLRLLLSGSDGEFTDSGDDGTGEVVRLRSRDGVKFITRGNDRLATELMKLVRADIAVADGMTTPVENAVDAVAEPLSPEQLAALPTFGAEQPEGEAMRSVPPENLPGPDYLQIARVGKDINSDSSTFDSGRSNTPPGSLAQQLFVEGLWPEAPAGRFDAFEPVSEH